MDATLAVDGGDKLVQVLKPCIGVLKREVSPHLQHDVIPSCVPTELLPTSNQRVRHLRSVQLGSGQFSSLHRVLRAFNLPCLGLFATRKIKQDASKREKLGLDEVVNLIQFDSNRLEGSKSQASTPCCIPRYQMHWTSEPRLCRDPNNSSCLLTRLLESILY